MSLVLPGDPLGSSSKFRPGTGTHLHTSQICASLLGPTTTTNPSAQSSKSLQTLSIAPRANTVLPEVDSVVLGRVVRLRQREAVLDILVVGETALVAGVLAGGGFQGVVRAQDVRATEKDRVKIGEMFRVGDIVRGAVISLGDQSSYYLSTAKNELGVIMATSEQGNAMYPISWKEFKDPQTGKTEIRKVAKPF